MASAYPDGLDSLSTSHQDNVDEIIHASTVNDLADAVNKIEAELGTDPKASAADVKTRIANTETVANAAIPSSYLDTDGTLAADSDTKIATQKAVKTYVDANAGGAGDTLHTVASSTASLAINFATADVWDITLSANCTFTLSGLTSGDPDYLTLILRQDGTGSRTVTWPTITWIGSGIAPTLQTAAGSVDSVVLFSFDGGTTVFGVAQTSASGLRSGTSFPGSPSDGDLFYRTDRRIMYEYVASITSWLSLDRKYVTFGAAAILPDGATTTGRVGALPVIEDVYVETWVSFSAGNATNNGSNFWTFTLSDPTNSAIGSFSTNGDTVGVSTRHVVSIGLSYAASSGAFFIVSSSKTGAPSNYRYAGVLIVRSIG